MKRVLWIAVGLLSLIGVVVVVRRTVVLIGASAEGLDEGFATHRILTFAHIIPALLFILLGPWQFVRGIPSRHPRFHRISGRIFVASGLIVGTTALIMSPQMAVGGANETAATMLFAILFLFSLVTAFVKIRQRKVAQHREWMIRAYAIGLAVATIRPIVGVFFATQRLTHLTPHEFFGIAFWLGFTLQTIAAEVYINYARASQQTVRVPQAAIRKPLRAAESEARLPLPTQRSQSKTPRVK